MHDSGKRCMASLLNTLWWHLYSAGMGVRFGLSCSSVSVEDVVWWVMHGLMWTLAMYRVSLLAGSGRSLVLGLNCGFLALASRRIRGSCTVSIHPRTQSIF